MMSTFINNEASAFEIIKPQLETVMQNNKLPPNYLRFNLYDQGGKPLSVPNVKLYVSEHDSEGVLTDTLTSGIIIFKLKLGKKTKYISLYHAYLPKGFDATNSKKDGAGYVKIPLKQNEDFLMFVNLLCEALNNTIDAIPTEFDCCHLYKECSDAKACVNEHFELSMHCGYKKIMKQGKIFYGHNRNV